MLLLIKKNSTNKCIEEIKAVLKNLNIAFSTVNSSEGLIIDIDENSANANSLNFDMLTGVYKCIKTKNSHTLIENCKNINSVKVKDFSIGLKRLCIIAGPCSIENEKQLINTAIKVKNSGANFLRGGAYKPRTSPYSFRGMEKSGYKILKKVADKTGLKTVSEVMCVKDLEYALNCCDMIQIGARNMQNFSLLKAIGKTNKPVLLKRGISATIDEWLYAAEYIMSEGNSNIVLCERGIRTFETSTRYTLDISSVPVIKSKCGLPIIVDPSHAAGNACYVKSLSLAAVAAGADGIMVEIHPNPINALSDPHQQLTFSQYDELLNSVKPIALAVNRTL